MQYNNGNFKQTIELHAGFLPRAMRHLWLLLAALVLLAAQGSALAQTWNGGNSAWGNIWSVDAWDPFPIVIRNWGGTGVPVDFSSPVFPAAPTTTTPIVDYQITVRSLNYSAGAPSYNLIIDGQATAGSFRNGILTLRPAAAGGNVINNGGAAQTITVSQAQNSYLDQLIFINSTMNFVTINNTGGDAISPIGGSTYFQSGAIANANIFNGAASTYNAAHPAGIGFDEGFTLFQDISSAGTSFIQQNASGTAGTYGGQVMFQQSATAANAVIRNVGSSTAGAGGGWAVFTNYSTAANAVIRNDGAGLAGAGSGVTFFSANATAGNSQITNFAGNATGANGGETRFYANAIAGHATIINWGDQSGGSLNALGGRTIFYDDSHAATAVITNFGANNSSAGAQGMTEFRDRSSASNAVIYNSPGNLSAFGGANPPGGQLWFYNSSTASNATINNGGVSVNGGASSAGQTYFTGNSSAGSSFITNWAGSGGAGNYGGITYFQGSSSASNATIMATNAIGADRGGAIFFSGSATGHMARVILYGDNQPGNNANAQLDISGLNTTPGAQNGTTIGSIEGSGEIHLGTNMLIVGYGTDTTPLGNATVNTNAVFTGSIQDGGAAGGIGGALTKVGSRSALTLSGTNYYTGGTWLTAGTLILNNPYAVGTNNAGAAGSGSLTVNGGTLVLNPLAMPSATNGASLRVQLAGNYSQTAGSLVSMVNGAANVYLGTSPTGQWGELNVGGTVDLGVAGVRNLTVSPQTPAFRSSIGDGVRVLNYTVSRTGNSKFSTFTDNTTHSGAAVMTNVMYDPIVVNLNPNGGPLVNLTNQVWAVWSADFVQGFTLTRNQREVARNLNMMVGTINTGNFGNPFNARYTSSQTNLMIRTAAGAADRDTIYYDSRTTAVMAKLGDLAQADLLRAYDLIAPEELTSAFNLGFAMSDAQGYNLLNRMQEIRGGSRGFSSAGLGLYDPTGKLDSSPQFASNLGPAAELAMSKGAFAKEDDNPWGVFVSGMGQFTHVGNDNNGSAFHMDTGGMTVGADYRFNENFAMGLALGYGNTRANVTGNGRVDANDAKGSLYLTYFDEGWHFEAMGGGGYGFYDTSRTALGGTASGNTHMTDIEGLIGGGYDWTVGSWVFGPQVHGQYTSASMSSFTESGSLAPLDIMSKTHSALRVDGLMHLIYVGKCNKVWILPEIRAGWQHNFGPRSLSLDSQFASKAGGVFTVYGPETGRDAALLGAGVSVQWSDTFSTYVNYDMQLGRQNYDMQAISAGVRIRL